MSPRTLPHATLASMVALAVMAGPLAATAGAQSGNGGTGSDWNHGWADASQPSKGPKSPQAPTGDQDDPNNPDPTSDPEPDGAYTGALVTTSSDTSSKPTAQPLTVFEMPFPCGEVWTGTTRASHSPSVRSVDFNRADDLGDPVVAAAAGVVTTAVTGKKRKSYGQFVVVDHGNDESTLYAHLDTVTVTVGQPVTAGSQVGTVGNTGNSYGAHLHFEERKGRSVVDSWFHGLRYVHGTPQASQNCGAVSIPDVPLAGNVIGNARAELVVFRRTDRPAFHVRRAPKADRVIPMGTSSDQPVLGDWDGDGKANPGVRNPSTRTFQLKVKNVVTKVRFGGRSDLAVAGDWDGDGRADVGVYDAAGNWSILLSGGNYTTSMGKSWGGAGFAPLPAFQ